MQIRKLIATGKNCIAILFFGVPLCFVLLSFFIPPAQSAEVSEQNIRDAVLGRATFTQEELQELDLNKDSQIDVADLVYFVTHDMPNSELSSLVGLHVGILFRDNASLIDGQGEVFGQMPFALSITSEAPPEGEIDNRSESDLGYYSLYFPKSLIPVTFMAAGENELKFRIEFKTSSSNLSPDSELSREMVFEGEFSDSGRRILSGTYEESVAGFKDNLGNDIPITLTGKFLLVLGNSDE